MASQQQSIQLIRESADKPAEFKVFFHRGVDAATVFELRDSQLLLLAEQAIAAYRMGVRARA